LRHRFAVATLIAWHKAGMDVDEHIGVLSAYLGHVHPGDTYWYYSDSRVIRYPVSCPRGGPVTWDDVLP
jgi:integrase/recombinase XerD